MGQALLGAAVAPAGGHPVRAGLEASLLRGRRGSDSGSTGIEGKWEVRGLSRKTAAYNFNVTSQDPPPLLTAGDPIRLSLS